MPIRITLKRGNKRKVITCSNPSEVNPAVNYKRDLSDAVKAHNRNAHNSANDNYNLANRLGSNHARTICRLAAASRTGESRSKVSLSIISAWADGLLPVGAGYKTQDRHDWMLPYIATLPRRNNPGKAKLPNHQRVSDLFLMGINEGRDMLRQIKREGYYDPKTTSSDMIRSTKNAMKGASAQVKEMNRGELAFWKHQQELGV